MGTVPIYNPPMDDPQSQPASRLITTLGAVLGLSVLVLFVDRVMLEPCGDGPALFSEAAKPVIQLSFFDVMPTAAFYVAMVFVLVPMVLVFAGGEVRHHPSRQKRGRGLCRPCRCMQTRCVMRRRPVQSGSRS